MPRQSNIDELAVLSEKLKSAKSFAIVEYSGTTGSDQVKLRQALQDAGAEFRVSKNTLMRLAVDNKALDASFEGQNAFVFSQKDEVGGIKALFTFHKDEDKLVIKQGLMGDKVLSYEELEALSKLPGKDQLIATLISRINAPGQGLVNVLKAGTRDLVQVLKAYADKQA